MARTAGRKPIDDPTTKDSQKDLLRAVGFGLCSIPAALSPTPLSRSAIEAALSVIFRHWPEKPLRMAERMRETLGSSAGDRDLLDEARNLYALDLEGAWGRAQNLLRTGWKPTFSFHGLERLSEDLVAFLDHHRG